MQVSNGVLDSDSFMKKEAFSDIMEIAAGTVASTGIENTSGVLSVAIHSLNAEVIATGDKIAFSDSGDNGLHSETVMGLTEVRLWLLKQQQLLLMTMCFSLTRASGEAKKESISDLVALQAGAGLQATNGVFSVKSARMSSFDRVNRNLWFWSACYERDLTSWFCYGFLQRSIADSGNDYLLGWFW